MWSETVTVAAELEENVLTTGAFLYRAYDVLREVASVLRVSEGREEWVRELEVEVVVVLL